MVVATYNPAALLVVGVGVCVRVGVGVDVRVGVDVSVGVAVNVGVDVSVGVDVGVGVCVGQTEHVCIVVTTPRVLICIEYMLPPQSVLYHRLLPGNTVLKFEFW